MGKQIKVAISIVNQAETWGMYQFVETNLGISTLDLEKIDLTHQF